MEKYYLRFVSDRGQTHYFSIEGDIDEPESLLTPHVLNQLILSVPITHRRDRQECRIECDSVLEQVWRTSLLMRNKRVEEADWNSGGSGDFQATNLTPFGFELAPIDDLKVPASVKVKDLTDHHRHLRTALHNLSVKLKSFTCDADMIETSFWVDPNSLTITARMSSKEDGESLEKWTFELKEEK